MVFVDFDSNKALKSSFVFGLLLVPELVARAVDRGTSIAVPIFCLRVGLSF